jgi:general stress protein YciG
MSDKCQDGLEPVENVPAEPAKTRGFASMTREQKRAIASKGGREAHARGVAHSFTTETGRTAGTKGGHATSQDRDHMAAIGARGGRRRWVVAKGLESRDG